MYARGAIGKKQETRLGVDLTFAMTVLEIPSWTLNDGHVMPGIGMGYSSRFHLKRDSLTSLQLLDGQPGRCRGGCSNNRALR
jgi:hypothetical protein